LHSKLIDEMEMQTSLIWDILLMTLHIENTMTPGLVIFLSYFVTV